MVDRKPGDKQKITCVICPNSCRLDVSMEENGEIKVEGFTCPRGEVYGKNEFTNPVRMLITTMKVNNGILPVIPVRSNKEVPKAQVFDAVRIVSETSVDAPVKMGQIIIKNLLGIEGINVIASRDMEKKK